MHYAASIDSSHRLHEPSQNRPEAKVKTLTIRKVPDELHRALQRERARRGTSLNQAVIELLDERLGRRGRASNGLARLAGTWTDEDLRRFEEATAAFERPDDELWR